MQNVTNGKITFVSGLHKYGMRSRRYGLWRQPKGVVAFANGGTVDGREYQSFIYYTDWLSKEEVAKYDLDYLGFVQITKAEEV